VTDPVKLILFAYVMQVLVGWLWSGLIIRLLGPETMHADAVLWRAGAHPGYRRRHDG
jgi:hypothetical protein